MRHKQPYPHKAREVEKLGPDDEVSDRELANILSNRLSGGQSGSGEPRNAAGPMKSGVFM